MACFLQKMSWRNIFKRCARQILSKILSHALRDPKQIFRPEMHFLFPLKLAIENFKEMQQRLQASELMNFSEGFNAAFFGVRE